MGYRNFGHSTNRTVMAVGGRPGAAGPMGGCVPAGRTVRTEVERPRKKSAYKIANLTLIDDLGAGAQTLPSASRRLAA